MEVISVTTGDKCDSISHSFSHRGKSVKTCHNRHILSQTINSTGNQGHHASGGGE